MPGAACLSCTRLCCCARGQLFTQCTWPITPAAPACITMVCANNTTYGSSSTGASSSTSIASTSVWLPPAQSSPCSSAAAHDSTSRPALLRPPPEVSLQAGLLAQDLGHVGALLGRLARVHLHPAAHDVPQHRGRRVRLHAERVAVRGAGAIARAHQRRPAEGAEHGRGRRQGAGSILQVCLWLVAGSH
jgi:hypothetical protein